MSCTQCGKKMSSGRRAVGSNWCRACDHGSSKRTHQSHKSNQAHQKPRVQQRQKKREQVNNYPVICDHSVSLFRYPVICDHSVNLFRRIVTMHIPTPKFRIVQYSSPYVVRKPLVRYNSVRIVCIDNKCHPY